MRSISLKPYFIATATAFSAFIGSVSLAGFKELEDALRAPSTCQRQSQKSGPEAMKNFSTKERVLKNSKALKAGKSKGHG